MLREDFHQAGESEQADPGPDLRQVLLLLLAGARDGRPVGEDQGDSPHPAEDGHAEERLRGSGETL